MFKKIFERLYNKILNTGLDRKMISVFIFLIILPISCVSIVSYQNYTNSIKKNTIGYVSEICNKTLSKLDDYIVDMKTISKVPSYSKDLQQYLVKLSSDPESIIERQKKLQSHVIILDNLKKGTDNIYVMDNDGNIFYGSNDINVELVDRFHELKKEAAKVKGAPVLLGTRRVTTNFSGGKFVFSVTRQIRNQYDNYKPIGTIVIDSDIGIIANAVSALDNLTNGKTILIDVNKKVIYDSEKKLLTQNISNHALISGAQQSNGSFSIFVDKKPYLCIYSTSPSTGWKMLVYIPTDVLVQNAKITRNITITATIVIALIALAVSVYLSFAITKPLRKLTMLMKKVGADTLDVYFPVKYEDEVGILGKQFNRMITRIKELINEVYLMQIRKKESELRALQSQINPHFIYNTLETIRMKAQIHGVDDLDELTYKFGMLLRYSINRGNEIVTIRQELEHLCNYMVIQNDRFDGRFSLIVDISEHLMSYKIIKLVFQPIVENAMFHGLEQKRGKAGIYISSLVQEENLYFQIRDDGVGMDPDTLKSLLQRIQSDEDTKGSKHGIGLRNVNERIKLHYGEQYGLDIESSPGKGTTVIIRLPYQAGAKEESNA